MVKICTDCYEVNAGGFRCHDCGGRLIHTSDAEAAELPESVWKTQRVDYGARRGMIVRFLGIFLGVGVGLYGLRCSVALSSPYNWIGAIASIIGGIVLWRVIHHAADRGVRLWVKQKGRVHKGRLAKAMLRKALR